MLPLALLLCLAGCSTISNDPRIRTPGTIIDDQMLERIVRADIRRGDPGFKSAHLVVVSYNGVVLLAGQVSSEPLRAKAENLARAIPKVRRVHNELEIGGPISYLARSNDSWLTAKVKSKLLAAKKTPATRVKVVTENGVVYLLGLLPREQAEPVVDVARSVYGVQKIVKVFEYLDDA
ncbi:MAG: BON domain-containing protein [Pseudomonadales bacterium]